MKNEKETCCYKNIGINYYFYDFDERGMYRQEKVRNRTGNQIRNNFYFSINQNVSKLQIILKFLSFKFFFSSRWAKNWKPAETSMLRTITHTRLFKFIAKKKKTKKTKNLLLPKKEFGDILKCAVVAFSDSHLVSLV